MINICGFLLQTNKYKCDNFWSFNYYFNFKTTFFIRILYSLQLLEEPQKEKLKITCVNNMYNHWLKT